MDSYFFSLWVARIIAQRIKQDNLERDMSFESFRPLNDDSKATGQAPSETTIWLLLHNRMEIVFLFL